MELDKLLNQDQYKAATFLDTHSRIIAGAGSGKTRVITYRIAYLIQSVGIDPRKILAITFTNKAANEMKERVESIIDTQGAGVLVCTIHSLCVRVLRQHSKLIGYPSSFIIMDEEDQKAIIKKIFIDNDIDSKTMTFKKVLSAISTYKISDISPQRALELAGQFIGEQTKANVYKAYVEYQKQHFMLDFDDLLVETHRIFHENTSVLEKWQDRFNYIHVDEFQDVGDKEYRIVKMLSKKSIVCVVGDPDQTIYSFRGANVNYILDYDKDFSPCTTIYLNQNYRSSGNILQVSNTLIRKNQNRLEKELFTEQEQGNQIVHYTGRDEIQEAQYICECIQRIVELKQTTDYKNILILYRANYLSRNIEQALIQNQIKYRLFGGVKFFGRKEIKDALSFIRLICFEDDLSFERVINVPARGVGKVTMDKIKFVAAKHNVSYYSAVANHFDEIKFSSKSKKEVNSLVQAVTRARNSTLLLNEIFENLLEDIGYLESLRDDVENNRIDNIKELQKAIDEYQKANPELATFENYLQDIALFTDSDKLDNDSYVSLMSIHMAKGLEFDYVFVIGLSDGVFPSIRSISEDGEEGLEEERRLAYVAFTRAKKQLILTDSGGFSFVTKGLKVVSRFVQEIGEDVVVHKGVKIITSNDDIEPRKKNTLQYKPVSDAKFAVGQQVIHDLFGKGVVIKVQSTSIDIAFALPHGLKSLKSDHPSIKSLLS